ncbi:cyclin-dependent kinase 2-interacting protein isoform 2-T3 [Menidia menidia]
MEGSARKLRDNAADWHNLMVRWDKLNEDGFGIATKIVNMRRVQSDQPLEVTSSPSQSPSLPSAAWQQTSELQEECCKLQQVIDKMAAIVSKMERLFSSQRGIQQLEEFQFGPGGRKSPLCHSWTTAEFVESARVLLAAFGQELKLKQTIGQEVAHTTSPDLSLVYLSSWLHQPYVPPKTRLTLEALLMETGHRPS